MKEAQARLDIQVIEKISALLTAAFGFIAALSWNNAITAFFTSVFGTPDALAPDVVYAIVVTVIAVVVTLWMSKILATAKERAGSRK